jgi:AraC-like DNA-binding protein
MDNEMLSNDFQVMRPLAETYLTLQLVRLKRSEAWPNPGCGFSFVLAKGGNGRYGSGSASKDFQAGDLLVLNSADGGQIAASGEDLIFWSFTVCVEHLYPLFAVGEICMLQDTVEKFKGPKLYPASSPLAQESHRLVALAPPQGNAVHRSQVLGIAAAVLSAEFKSARSDRVGFVRIEDHMMQVLEELSPTDLLTLSVGEMARKFSCSRRHLNRLFHQHFGCSVASVRMELRLLKALLLLRDPGVKIINVAQQCGFNHLGLFNACFKRRFGHSPGRWRKGAPNGVKPNSDLDVGHPACPMHAHGLCPWTPKAAVRSPMAGKNSPTDKLGNLSGPCVPKLREMIVRDIRKVATDMRYKSSPGVLVRSDH